MSEKKILPQPTMGELELLGVFWGTPPEDKPLRLSEVHQRLAALREKHGGLPPALTSVSNSLRAMLARGLLKEMRRRGDETVAAPSRTLYSSRSPQTAYTDDCDPADILPQICRMLLDACPPEKRVDVLVELIKEMKLEGADLKRLQHELPKK